jgi:apolipoprotein N-acyltransferase
MYYKTISLSILSAILLILSFPKPNLEILAWFALVPWIFALQGQKSKQAFFLSYLVGIVFFAGIVYWINYVSILGFVVLVLYLALYFAIFGWIFSQIFSESLAKSNLLFIPSIWVVLEYIRSHLFSGFGWALLGYSQYRNLSIIQISDITGSYGVSFLIVLVNIGIWQMLRAFFNSRGISILRLHPAEKSLKYFRCSFPLYWAFYPLLSVFLILGYGHVRLNQPVEGEDIKVAVVQGNIPQKIKWDLSKRDFILEKYTQLTEDTLSQHPQIIIWPETSVPGYLENESELFFKVSSLSKQIFPAYLLVGTPHQGVEQKVFNSATLLYQGKVSQRYQKLHLVPFGEFIPWPGIFSRFSFASLIGDFTAGSDYTVFSISNIQAKIKLSALICFEDVFAHLARRFVQKGAQFLVNITNDAWFGDSAEPEQHLQASVFRAVENKVNVVRAANTGISCFINPWGDILARVANEAGRDVLIAGKKIQQLRIASIPTFYSAWGDVFTCLCLAIVFFKFASEVFFKFASEGKRLIKKNR